MALKLFERLKGTDKIAEFVDKYNNNNEIIEQEIDQLKVRVKQLEDNYDKKVDKIVVVKMIEKEVEKAISSANTPFAKVEDIKPIVATMLGID